MNVDLQMFALLCSKAEGFQAILYFVMLFYIMLSHLPQTASTHTHYPRSLVESLRAGDAAQPLSCSDFLKIF